MKCFLFHPQFGKYFNRRSGCCGGETQKPKFGERRSRNWLALTSRVSTADLSTELLSGCIWPRLNTFVFSFTPQNFLLNLIVCKRFSQASTRPALFSPPKSSSTAPTAARSTLSSLVITFPRLQGSLNLYNSKFCIDYLDSIVPIMASTLQVWTRSCHALTKVNSYLPEMSIHLTHHRSQQPFGDLLLLSIEVWAWCAKSQTYPHLKRSFNHQNCRRLRFPARMEAKVLLNTHCKPLSCRNLTSNFKVDSLICR